MFFHKHSRRAGFSLIEVNMAIFVLAGGVLALLGLFPLGLRQSVASRSEMRIAAFAERLIGAAQIAANDPTVQTSDDLADALTASPFNFTLDDDPGESDGNINVTEDATSGVYYHAWLMEDENYRGFGDMEVAHIGVQVTAENAKQNRWAIKNAPVYVIRIPIDKKLKQ